MGRVGGDPKVDLDGRTVVVGEDGLIRIDGIVLAKIVPTPGGEAHIQIYDRDRLRSVCRGTRQVEVPLEVLIDKLRRAIQM